MVRYKAIATSPNMYREIELLPDNKEIMIGTTPECNFRLSKDGFFGDVEISFQNSGDNWTIVCSDNNYISTDGIVKLARKELTHGDEFIVKYRDSNQEVFQIQFVIDFDYDTKNYEREIDISNKEVISIGGSHSCDIVLHDPLIGEDTIYLQKKAGMWEVEDKGSDYGVQVNGVKINGKFPVHDFDFFSIVGFSFYKKYNKLYTSKNNNVEVVGLSSQLVSESNSKFKYPKFIRNTRLRYDIPKEDIPILDPPTAPTKPQQNLIMSLIPTMAALFITVFLRSRLMGTGSNSGFIIISALTMSIGIITSIITHISQTRNYKKDVIKREEDYAAYIENKRKMISEKRNQERALLEDKYYDTNHLLDMVDDFSSDLFNRTKEDDDYLHVRIGTGPVKSLQQVGYKEQEKFESEDELAGIPAEVEGEFRYLTGAPITVDCANNGAIGIAGTRPKLYSAMKNIFLDISTRQYYTDVSMFFMVNEERAEEIAWIRFLPHIYNTALDMRNIVCDSDSKNFLFEYLYKELSNREATGRTSPNLVIFVYDDVGLKRHPISNFIEKAKDLGVTFIFFEESKEFLPLGCTQVVLLNNNDDFGEIVDSHDDSHVLEFSYEPIEENRAHDFVQKLAPVYCEAISLEGTLTKNISLFELLEIYSAKDLDLGQRWEQAEIYKTMAAPLGVNSKNEVVNLDLHEKFHGPHGLVAGTTGSGKSEILQSYILSMATLFHPHEVGFVIIDFKGGGMVNQFKNLPHLTGAITNIDGREIDRSLLSIKAELRKRQALFFEFEVNHIDAYIKLYKRGEATIPLPHLILIVDEFAELKTDQPEFMKELISAARIGRSLGVHLILATQKPSGVVDAQIWSNSKFKLCLKVQNKEDSNEVLKTPLAAEIKEPGRAYLQVGNNEIFELFQSAYSGAPAVTDMEVKKKYDVFSMDLSGKRSLVFSQKASKGNDQADTQLESIVDYVADYCEQKQIAKVPGICLPPLRENIPYMEVAAEEKRISALNIPLGIYDDPDNQLQAQYSLDLYTGNLFIVGASQFGKTNMLQTIIRGIAQEYTPAEASIYILDFASMALNIFDDLAHIGGVVTASEDIKLKTFFRMMMSEIAFRKEKLSKLGITSFSSYKEGGFTDLPFIVIMIDNLMAFRELYEIYDDDLMNLCREGLAVGINIIATAAATRSLSYKYMSSFANKISLYCNSRDEYSALFERCRMEPKSVPGRALMMQDKVIYEYQNYLPFEGEREIERVSDIKEFILATNAQNISHAKRIPEVPELLTVEYVKESLLPPAPYTIIAGMDFDTVDSAIIDLQKQGYVAISGKEKSGKTNFIRYMFYCLQQEKLEGRNTEAFVADGYERQLQFLENDSSVVKYSTEMEELIVQIDNLEVEADRRKELIKQQGLAALASLPLLLLVIENAQVYEADGLPKATGDKLKKLLKMAKEVKLFAVFSNIENAPIAYGAPDILKQFKETKNIIFFDDLAAFKMIDISMADLRANKKRIEVGDAFYILERSLHRIKTPLVYEEI